METDKDYKLTLRDGRNLGFRLLGDLDGLPLFFFHGTPGSRHFLSPNDLLATIPGLFVILPDRPGYGLSDPKPGRHLLDWADDVMELADHIGLNSFAVAGGSGGGPHALACAHKYPERITHTLLFSSPAPAHFKGATKGMSFGNKLGIFLNRYAGWILKPIMNSYARSFQTDPQKFVQNYTEQMVEQDRHLMQSPEWQESFIKFLSEAYRQGAEGQLADVQLTMTTRPWGFDLKDITVPVYIWQGSRDNFVTENMAKYLSAEIPKSEVHIIEDSGHLLTENEKVIDEVRNILDLPKAV